MERRRLISVPVLQGWIFMIASVMWECLLALIPYCDDEVHQGICPEVRSVIKERSLWSMLNYNFPQTFLL